MINLPIKPLKIIFFESYINKINKGLENEKLKINDISRKDVNDIEEFF